MDFKTFPLRLSAVLHRKLKIAAAKEGITLHMYCVRVLSKHVEEGGDIVTGKQIGRAHV